MDVSRKIIITTYNNALRVFMYVFAILYGYIARQGQAYPVITKYGVVQVYITDILESMQSLLEGTTLSLDINSWEGRLDTTEQIIYHKSVIVGYITGYEAAVILEMLPDFIEEEFYLLKALGEEDSVLQQLEKELQRVVEEAKKVEEDNEI